MFLKINKIENCTQIVLLGSLNDKLVSSMGEDQKDKNTKKENDDQNLNGNSHSNFVKIRKNQDEF